MNIALAQTKSIKGDIAANITRHMAFIEQARLNHTDLILFPELSITGYEPKLAEALAIAPSDARLEEFQKISDRTNITVGIGAPVRYPDGVCISLILFRALQKPLIYSKQHLHVDEDPYFIKGTGWNGILEDQLAFAICYEISIPEHSKSAFESGANIYLASVAKTADGMREATAKLASIAHEYGMVVGVSNCIGQHDGVDCVGMSGVWNKRGEFIAQLDQSNEGLLLCKVQDDNITATVIPVI